MAERQTAAYKEKKKDILKTKPAEGRQNGSIKPPPDYFWDEWRTRNHIQYPRGIDHSTGCTSTRISTEAFAKIQLGLQLDAQLTGDTAVTQKIMQQKRHDSHLSNAAQNLGKLTCFIL